jgi:riboflavin-specific deaminase-like protein
MEMATGTVPVEAIVAEIQALQETSRRLPLVTLTYAQSLDGCIAARRGERYVLSGPESKHMTHQLRAAHDAILVGIGTILADDPRLTARLAGGANPQPVVLDSWLRFPPGAQLLLIGSPWIATTPAADPQRCAQLEQAGAQVLTLPAGSRGGVSLKALLERLGEMKVGSLMVEGGGQVIGSFLQERLVDYIVLTITPLYLGGLPAVDNVPGSALPRLENPRYAAFGEDLVVWGRPVWQNSAVKAEES